MSVQQIVQSFARSASRYDAHAQVQIQCADRLAAFMEANTRDLVPGTILEVGCGTGLVSRRLAEMFPGRQLEITDACEEMLGRCRMRMNGAAEAAYKLLDVETLHSPDCYALVAAAFVLQWVDDLPGALHNLTQSLQPGGKLFFSLPTAGSFPEWRQICKQAGVTYTANELPPSSLFRQFAAENNMRLSVYEETFPVHHVSFESFLLSLKSLGAGTSLSANRLTLTETRRLLKAARSNHPQSFTATYKVLFGHLSKPL